MPSGRRMTRRRQAGYTIIEIMIGLLVIPTIFVSFTGVFGSSDGLAERSRVSLRAHEDLRGNLEAVANLIRQADIDTLDGFDVDGITTAPSFRRVLGADATGPVHTGLEGIRWEPLGRDVDGIEAPGRLVHVHDSGSTVVAYRVPAGGFRIIQEGNNLEIELTTYYVTSSDVTTFATARTAIALRN